MNSKYFKFSFIFIIIIMILINIYKLYELNEKYLLSQNELNNLKNNYLSISNELNIINKNNETNIINHILSKLNFPIKNYKIDRKDNKLIIKCYNYFINLDKYSSYIPNYNIDNIKTFEDKILNYKQPEYKYINHYLNEHDQYKQIMDATEFENYNFNDRYNPALFLCIELADIIINLDDKKYKIITSDINIRKPTYDNYNIFSKFIKNLNNPNYYFINEILDENLDIIYGISYLDNPQDYIRHTYYIPPKIDDGYLYNINTYVPYLKSKIIFKNDDNDKLIIEPIIKESPSDYYSSTNQIKILCDINYQPCYSNQIKINKLEGSYI